MVVRRTLSDRIRSAGLTSWALIGIALVIYGFFRYLISPLGVIFAPIAIAVVVVYLLNPVVSMLERRGLRRGLGVLFVYVLFLAIMSVLFTYLIPAIGRQVTALIDALPGYVQKVVDQVNKIAAERGSEFRLELSSEQVFEYLQRNREAIFGFLGGVRSVAAGIVHIMITVVIGVILSVYLLLDLPKIQAAFVRVIPRDYRDEAQDVFERVGAALGGFFRGQLFVAAFVGVASAALLSLPPVKLPFSVLIGFLAGIFNLVPLIGPFLAAIPAVLIGLLSDRPISALWAGLALLIVQQIDNHIVSPNVMGRTVRLHPITVMLALLVGGTLAGILGMLI
ncbi:MAG TPA: AI-2E family transporter, partial [Actinomycetota bacterium]|nr:AI-2E family transporter [Actinomycetota bacterium]